MTDWIRLWHDMPTNPKWRTIARKSGQRVGDVIAVFNFLMVNASRNASERGTLSGLDIEDVATALDLQDEEVRSILSAMQGKVLDGDRLTGWEKRQPKREDGTAAERKAAWKERKDQERKELERTGTHWNAPETETETETDIPLSNDNGRVVAPKEDSDKLFWDSAKAFLKPESRNPGALIGKWCRDYGKDAAAQAVTRAQLERPAQRVPFIEGCLRKTRAPEPVIPI